MSAPPSYKERTSQEQLEFDVKNLSTQDKKELLDSSSMVSSDDAPPYSGFSQATQTYSIGAHGVPVFRLPLPYSELEIPVVTADGTLAYMHTREKRSSGNGVLSSPTRGDLVASTYRFGPGRDPTLKLLQKPEGANEILVSSKWTSRKQIFNYSAAPIVFSWHYIREKVLKPAEQTKDGKEREKKVTLLVLEVEGKGKGENRRIAQLLRDEETRPEGTRGCTAGNGGELKIDGLAAQRLGIPEELIVGSCIMMLKKEIDRRRAMQFAMLAAIVSGGS